MQDSKTNFDGLYTDATRYDFQHQFYEKDIEFYLDYLKNISPNCSVLELAIGTGRIGLKLQSFGFNVFGIDTSDVMLNEAKAKASSNNIFIELANADMTDFKLDRKFDVIILPMNTLIHLEDYQAQKKCLECVREHLSKTGIFILDVFNPNLRMLLRKPENSYPLITYHDSRLDSEVEVTESSFYDSKTQINRIKYHFKIDNENTNQFLEFGMRIFFPAELDNLLLFNGFQAIIKYGDYDFSPFLSESPRQIIVCKLENN
jgi:Methyltransferase domain